MIEVLSSEQSRYAQASHAAMLREILCGPWETPAAPPAPATPQLLTVRDAAKALAVCEKTLWALTDRGEIPVVRIGRSVRYDPHDLTRWIERKKAEGN